MLLLVKWCFCSHNAFRERTPPLKGRRDAGLQLVPTVTRENRAAKLGLDISGATKKETLNYINEILPSKICLKYEVYFFKSYPGFMLILNFNL